jgi:Aldehyde dehydrogenase family
VTRATSSSRPYLLMSRCAVCGLHRVSRCFLRQELLSNVSRQLAAGVSLTGCHIWCLQLQDDMKIAMEEIFGPVQVILKYKTIDEVLCWMPGSCITFY